MMIQKMRYIAIVDRIGWKSNMRCHRMVRLTLHVMLDGLLCFNRAYHCVCSLRDVTVMSIRPDAMQTCRYHRRRCMSAESETNRAGGTVMCLCECFSSSCCCEFIVRITSPLSSLVIATMAAENTATRSSRHALMYAACSMGRP